MFYVLGPTGYKIDQRIVGQGWLATPATPSHTKNKKLAVFLLNSEQMSTKKEVFVTTRLQ